MQTKPHRRPLLLRLRMGAVLSVQDSMPQMISPIDQPCTAPS
jgi:hypothetical protein